MPKSKFILRNFSNKFWLHFRCVNSIIFKILVILKMQYSTMNAFYHILFVKYRIFTVVLRHCPVGCHIPKVLLVSTVRYRIPNWVRFFGIRDKLDLEFRVIIPYHNFHAGVNINPQPISVQNTVVIFHI